MVNVNDPDQFILISLSSSDQFSGRSAEIGLAGFKMFFDRECHRLRIVKGPELM